jgi:two-component system, cell cycle sensor histidine kinase and response regulator CckA
MITAMAGYAELLRADIAAGLPPQLADLDQILETSRRAASLTQQLLAFSRKQLLQPEVLSLNAVVLQIEPLLRRLIGEDVHLATNLAPDPCLIEIDPGQIQQVILNLVVNARDAMPGGGLLELGTFLSARDNRPPVVALVVSDTGHGMNAATLARIFEPFFTTKERGKGTGLGLATVYGIVAQSGGEITVESREGEGSAFTILLPQVSLAEGQLAVANVAGEPAGARGNEHVLLVEDDLTIRNLLATVLRKEGYQVMAARDGEEAIRLATTHAGNFDLLITDVIMPGMSGAELVRRLEAAHVGLPVLYISGYTDDAISMHGVSAASVAFLQKPFHPGDFTRKVRAVLEQLGAAATPHARPGPGWYGSS